MSNIQIYKKPLLAVLSDEKKIREYSDVERLTIAKKIVETLLNGLGVGNKSNEEHHIAAIKYIANDKNFTPSEYNKAFELVLDGTLKIDLFQQVNCLIISKVMSLYKTYKAERLRVYRKKEQERKFELEMQEHKNNYSDRDATIKMFNNFKVKNRITEFTVVHIYKYLYDLGVLPKHTKEFKEEMTRKAKAVKIFESKQKNDVLGGDLISITKRLVVDRYFRSLIINNINIETEL